MQFVQLPHIDEHTTTIAASGEDVWRNLIETVDRAFSGALQGHVARALGCADRAAAGPRPFTVGSTAPGFRVTASAPGSELALEGRHRFSRYALIFRLEQAGPSQSRLRAETRALFPGFVGGVYRSLVIGTGGHVLVVRRLLSVVKLRSERIRSQAADRGVGE